MSEEIIQLDAEGLIEASRLEKLVRDMRKLDGELDMLKAQHKYMKSIFWDNLERKYNRNLNNWALEDGVIRKRNEDDLDISKLLKGILESRSE